MEYRNTGQCTAMTGKNGPGGGRRCKRPAIKGGTVCSTHGGLAPQVKAAAARRAAEAEAKAEIARQGIDLSRGQDPLSALEGTLAEQLALRDRLREVVAKLQDDSLRYAGRAGEQIRGELVAYQAILRDVEKTASNMLKLNLAERRQALNEAQAVILLQVVERILGDLELTPAQQTLALEVVPARLMEAGEQEDQDVPPKLIQASPVPRNR